MSSATSHVSARSGELRRRFQLVYAPVARELEEAEALLHRRLRSRHACVNALLEHGLRLGGKRLRPALLLLSGKAAGDVSRDHIVLAAVVEMIHTATLVHDDVLDEATLRRHSLTVNARWSNQASILLGDYLFTQAFSLASSLDSTLACRQIGRATNETCEGELRQIDSRGRFELSEAEYLEIIEAKTAALCATCCRLGAHAAGASESQVESLAEFGRSLGIAFQIVDDLLDLEGEEGTTGKSLGTDLEQQKPTLPLIHLLAEADAPKRAELEDLLRLPPAPRREALAVQLRDSAALDYARQTAQRYADAARACLEVLPAGEARAGLQELAGLVVDRRG